MQSYSNSDLDLSEVFEQETGYHGVCWATLTETSVEIDRSIPAPLQTFVDEVVAIIRDNGLTETCRVGCAYVRILDGSKPENHLRWHIDNEDGGVRFSTAISTDDTPVNLAWTSDPTLVTRKVAETDWKQAHQPANGEIVVFTTEPHGVLPLPARSGEKTAVFFATFYTSREVADLYTTNCTNETTPHPHAALPTLETTR